MHLGKIDRWTRAEVPCARENPSRIAPEFHQLLRRRQPEKSRARFRAQVPADMMMFLDKCFPKFFIILPNEIKRRRQTQVMSVIRQQLHAEAVNGAKESAIE